MESNTARASIGTVLAGGLGFAVYAVTLQAGLGIVTLLHQAPLPLALAHQILAIIVFTVAVMHAEGLSQRLAYQLPRSRPAEQGV